ncbi:MAG: GGDEF domain-containing protein [Planctomycetes bacterium]|nr:GGDEF domain-containing protein [Planctomycetota bacterium]
MSEAMRWFWVGTRADVLQAAQSLLGQPPVDLPLDEIASGDLVLIDARAGDAAEELPHGHVFSGVRVLKATKGVRVFVIVDHDDPVGTQLARFCLADGALTYDVETRTLDGAGLLAARNERRRPTVDQLLQKVEADLAARGGGESTLQRLLRFESDVSLLTRLQDPETGLLDGPYATLKLDEEWKRAIRFHQPLSLLLLDVGRGLEEADADERRAALAEVAGVFLNECRDIDVLARFAPTVFLFLLPGTGPDGAEVLARRMLTALRERPLGGVELDPACGLAAVPSSEIGDRKAFLVMAESCLRRAQAGAGDGGLCATWQ